MKTYITIEPIRHDGKDIPPGSTIELDDKQAEALIACKAIEADGKAAVVAPTDPAERQAAIVAAIATLDADNGDLWLKDGKPNADAINAVLGYTVTAAERNAAWAEINAPK